jgi:glycosyltransferase involved in cell wall biosynthesis
MKQRVVFCGIVNLYTGYGLHSIKIISGLEKAGFDVFVRPLELAETVPGEQKLNVPQTITRHFVNRAQEDEWEILLCPPKQLPTPGKKTIYFTMWESTRISKRAVALLNLAEAVVVPCKWCRQSFIESGVTRPIFVVPLGINTDVFRYHPLPEGEKFVFGCAGRIKHGDERKGLKDVLRAFTAAFPSSVKDVELRVKGFADCKLGEFADKRIVLDERYMAEGQYAHWLKGLNVFVSAARAEGWGWHQHEAMAMGRPLIAAKYGGLAEFFDETAGICIPFKEVPAKEVWKGLGTWAQPDFRALASSMRWAYQNRGKLTAMGTAAARRAARFSDDHADQRLRDVMMALGMIS